MNAEVKKRRLDVISEEPGRSTIPAPAPLPCRTFDGPSSRAEYEKAYRDGKAAGKEVEEEAEEALNCTNPIEKYLIQYFKYKLIF